MMGYKYVKPDRLDVLAKGRIRFTQANALNDPFEVNPCFTEFLKGSLEYARENFKGEMPTEDEILEYASREVTEFRKNFYLQFLKEAYSSNPNRFQQLPNESDISILKGLDRLPMAMDYMEYFCCMVLRN